MSALAALAIVAVTALAQQPEAGYVFPPVVAPGTQSEVALGGYDFTPDMEFRVLDPRVGLETLGPPGEFLMPKPPYWFGSRGGIGAEPIPREVPVRIHVPADVTPGSMAWQAVNANGGSAARRFLISTLPIVIESRRRADVQDLTTLPAIIAARLGRNAEIDRYRFTASATAPLTVRLFARRLGANFNAILKVTDEQGQIVVDVADTAGLDTTATFFATAGTRYTVHVTDIDFRGNRAFVYALEVTSGPRVLATLPAAGKRGTSQDVAFVGYGLAHPPGENATGVTNVTRRVDFPIDPRHHSFDYKLETPCGTTVVKILLSDLEESVSLEQSTTDATSSERRARRLVVPAAVSARIEAAQDEDRYIFEARQDEAWHVAVHARTLGSSIDPFVRVIDAKGKEIGKSDDVAGTVDCRFEFSAPTDGLYTVVVSDRSGPLNPSGVDLATRSIYRLVLDRAPADFSLSAPQTVNLAVGKQAELPIHVQRIGGHKGEIDLAITGLPEGVTAPNVKIPAGASEVKVPLTATGDCATQSTYLQVIGVSQIGDDAVARVAKSVVAGNLCPLHPARETTPRILLATTLTSPVTIDIVDRNRQRAVPRGTTYPAPISITRVEGYEGEISLIMAARQARRRQGIRAPVVKVPAGAKQIEFPCFLPEWLETDRTSRMVALAMAKVTDAKGKERYLLSKAKSRITFILEGALLKVTHASGEVEAHIGSAFDMIATVRRVARFMEPVTLELLFPNDVREQFKTTAVHLPSDQENVQVRVEVPTDASLVGEHDVIIRATAIEDGKWPVVSQTTVTVVIVP